MADKEYDSIEDLIGDLQNAVDDSLNTEVTQTVKPVMEQAIQNTVYDVYNPKVYIRRGELGNPKNINATVENHELSIENDAPVNFAYDTSQGLGMPLADQVAMGVGYAYMNMPPRDFYKTATDYLESNNLIAAAIADGLIRQGFDADES